VHAAATHSLAEGALSSSDSVQRYNRFHEWIGERRLLRELGINQRDKRISLAGAHNKAVLAILRHCPDVNELALTQGTLDNDVLLLLGVRCKARLISLDLTGSRGFDAEGIKHVLAECLHLQKLVLTECEDVSGADYADEVPEGCTVVLAESDAR